VFSARGGLAGSNRGRSEERFDSMLPRRDSGYYYHLRLWQSWGNRAHMQEAQHVVAHRCCLCGLVSCMLIITFRSTKYNLSLIINSTTMYYRSSWFVCIAGHSQDINFKGRSCVRLIRRVSCHKSCLHYKFSITSPSYLLLIQARHLSARSIVT